jgi:hypothetical protein
MGAKDVFTNPQFCPARELDHVNNANTSLLNGSVAMAVSMMKSPLTSMGASNANIIVEKKTVRIQEKNGSHNNCSSRYNSSQKDSNSNAASDLSKTTEISSSSGSAICGGGGKSISMNGARLTMMMGANNNDITNTSEASCFMDEEWHQKYAFIIGLLRKPHALMVKDSLIREREKLLEKLNAYRLERNLVRDSIKKQLRNG